MSTAKKGKATGVHLLTAAGASLALWFVLLAFGGGCLAWYYRSIRYFPKIEWHECLNYLAVLSIIGGGLVVVFSLLAFLPGVVWAEVLLSDCNLGPALRYTRTNGKKEACIISVSEVLGFPFAVFILLVHMFIGVASALKPGVPPHWIITPGAALSLILATWLFVLMVRRALRREATRPPAPPPAAEVACTFHALDTTAHRASMPTRSIAGWLDSSMAKYLAAFVISGALGLVAVLMIEDLLDIDDLAHAVAMSSICAAVIVAANMLVAIVFKKRPGAAALAATLATLLLLVTGEGFEGSASLLHKVMASYGVGEGTRNVVVVTKEGLALLAAQGVNAEATESSLGLGRVRNVAILSRLGDEFVMRCGTRAITLPSAMVASWSAGTPLVNADIIAWAEAAPPNPTPTMIQRIQGALLFDFDLSASGTRILRRRHVPTAVIEEMVRHSSCASCNTAGFAGCAGAPPHPTTTSGPAG